MRWEETEDKYSSVWHIQSTCLIHCIRRSPSTCYSIHNTWYCNTSPPIYVCNPDFGTGLTGVSEVEAAGPWCGIFDFHQGLLVSDADLMVFWRSGIYHLFSIFHLKKYRANLQYDMRIVSFRVLSMTWSLVWRLLRLDVFHGGSYFYGSKRVRRESRAHFICHTRWTHSWQDKQRTIRQMDVPLCGNCHSREIWPPVIWVVKPCNRLCMDFVNIIWVQSFKGIFNDRMRCK